MLMLGLLPIVKKKLHRDSAKDVVESHLYEHARRKSAKVQPKRFGCLTDMTPKRLFGQMHWGELQGDVEAAQAKNPSSKFIGCYARVVTDAWNAAEPDVRLHCTVEAKKLNNGEGSIASKALYGDSCFRSFCDTVTSSAEKWFGATVIMVSVRPNVKGDPLFAVADSPKEARSLTGFLRNVGDRYTWGVQDFVKYYNGAEAGLAPTKPTLVLYHPSGQPLLPPFHGALLKIRRDILTAFMNVHYFLTTSTLTARTPWAAMGRDVAPWIKPKYLPTLPNGDQLIIRQPRDMSQEHLDAWMGHLWDRQVQILQSESAEWVFRFTIGKDTKGMPFASHYNADFMHAYAESQNVFLGSSSIVPLPTRRNRGTSAAAEEEVNETPPPTGVPTEREVRYDTSADTLPSEIIDDDDVDADGQDREAVGPAEEFGVGDDGAGDRDALPNRDVVDPVVDDVDEESDDENVEMVSPIVTRPLTPIDLTRSSPSPPATLPALPQVGIVRSGMLTSQPVPSDDFMSLFEDPPLPVPETDGNPSHDDPINEAPQWALSSLEKRYRYLNALSTNEWYRDIVEWFRESQSTLNPIKEPVFSWVSWGSRDLALPETIHHDELNYKTLMLFWQDWRSNAPVLLADPSKVEQFLLLSGLVYRELHRMHFVDDPDTPPYPLPDYITNSRLKEKVLDGLSVIFRDIAACISPLRQWNIKNKPPASTVSGHSRGAVTIGDIVPGRDVSMHPPILIATTNTKATMPKPRKKKPTAKTSIATSSAPTITASPSGSSSGTLMIPDDCGTPPPPSPTPSPSSSLPPTPAIRRTGRQHIPNNQYNDYMPTIRSKPSSRASPPPPIASSGEEPSSDGVGKGRGRGQAKATRGKTTKKSKK
ncbi:hypothetical protein QCA50_018680 [Cerrena zonata]|uniref:Uncharacterized protein n=1 Tax=Cerrena zonata TaxID=2478898 RepID=A0AAW0FGD1_9APHY